MTKLDDSNNKAREAIKAEKAKLGIPETKRDGGTSKSDDIDEDLDKGDLEDDELEDDDQEETEEEDDTEEDDSEDDDEEDDEEEDDSETDDDEDDEEEEDEEDKKSKSNLARERAKKDKFKKQRDDARRKLAEALADRGSDGTGSDAEFEKEINELAKELDIEDPEALKKMLAVFKKNSGSKEVEDLKKKVEELSKDRQERTETVAFSKEWKGFKSTITKEYPEASDKVLEKMQDLMDELSHAKETGGKLYKDSHGNLVLDPYPMDYIYFKNRSKFDELFDGKKRKGMETGRSQKHVRSDVQTSKKLPKNATPAQIRQRAKEMAEVESGGDSLRTPLNREI